MFILFCLDISINYYNINIMLLNILLIFQDVNTLAKKLPNVVDKLLVTQSKLNHYDLLLGRNIRQLVYNQAITLIEKYTVK